MWQLETSFHITIFVPRLDGEMKEAATKFIEEALIEFCGARYQRTEPIEREGEPVWSYNAVICDEEEQYVSRLPVMRGVSTFSIWSQERQVEFASSTGGTR
ncbi:MAG: hypothetical protein AB7J35_19560 [Dehalococcoidia bacterium]